MIEETGVPSDSDIDLVWPPSDRTTAGPVAVIECFQRIPCDVCYYACPREAIARFEDINDLPKVLWERCTGCGVCVSACPGLAIFVIDLSTPGDFGKVGIPYEFLPVPKAGERVRVLDRLGEFLCDATITRVTTGKGNTKVLWLCLPKVHVRNARMIEVQRDGRQGVHMQV